MFLVQQSEVALAKKIKRKRVGLPSPPLPPKGSERIEYDEATMPLRSLRKTTDQTFSAKPGRFFHHPSASQQQESKEAAEANGKHSGNDEFPGSFQRNARQRLHTNCREHQTNETLQNETPTYQSEDHR